MGSYLNGGRQRSVGTAKRNGLDNPVFQPQWWQSKHYPSTSSRILVFKQRKNITGKDDVACGSIVYDRRLSEHPACCKINFLIGINVK